MVYAWDMYPLDITKVVRSFYKKVERFLFTYKLSLGQLLTLQLKTDDKRNHHRILKNIYCTMKKLDVVG